MSASEMALEAVVYAPHGDHVITSGRDQTIRAWDATSGALLWRSVAHDGWITTLAYSPDGHYIISGSRDKTVRLLDAHTGELLRISGNHADIMNSVAFSADSQLIASADRNGDIHVYDLATEQRTAQLANKGGAVWQIVFSPDGQTLIAASENGTIRFYELETGTHWQFVAHDVPITRMIYKDDGSTLITSGLDGVIKVWDVQSGTITEKRTLEGHTLSVTGLSLLADDLLLSSSLDGRVLLWYLTEDAAPTTMLHSDTPLMGLASRSEQAATINHAGELTFIDASPTAIAGLQSSTILEILPQPNTKLQEGLHIPGINVTSAMTTFPLDGKGITWEIDPWEHLVGHFYGTAWLGQTGNVVVGGHSEYPDGTPGIFSDLYEVGLGDTIYLGDDSTTQHYIVVNIRLVDYQELSVIRPTSHKRLTLITCDIPSYVAEQGFYNSRLVIIADAVD